VTRNLVYTINAFNAKTGVEVATGDVNGDGVLDIIAAQNGIIRTYDGTTGQQFTTTIGQFRPFGAGYKGRVYIATGRLDNDGSDDIVAGRGVGNATVRGWASTPMGGFNPGTILVAFNAYKGSKTGVRVAVGQFDGVGVEEIYTTPGNKRAMEVRVFDVAKNQLAARAPFGNGFKKGGFLAAGDFNNDGRDDIIVSGAGQQVVVLDAANIAGPFLGSFLPFPGFAGALRVGAVDGDQDGDLDILAARAGTNRVVGFFDLLGSELLPAVEAFEPAFSGGLTIAGG
jgi:hypothetical protein